MYGLVRVRVRVGQNHIYTPYMTVCMVISLLKLLHVHRIYVYTYVLLALANLSYGQIAVTLVSPCSMK